MLLRWNGKMREKLQDQIAISKEVAFIITRRLNHDDYSKNQ